MTPAAFITLVVGALVTSTISGILGMGGGITLLAIMTTVLAPGLVVPLHGVVQLASNFTRSLVFLRHVQWKIMMIYAPPMTIGVAIAVRVWSGSQLTWFRPAIGLFLLVFVFWRRWSPKLRNPPLWIYAPVGLAAGFLTIFVGATGPFIAPFFLRDDFEKENVIATKAVVQAWGHLLKLPAFFAIGFDYTPHLPLLGALLVCVVLGTLLGKRILKLIPHKLFVFLFEATLLVLAIHLIWQSI